MKVKRRKKNQRYSFFHGHTRRQSAEHAVAQELARSKRRRKP